MAVSLRRDTGTSGARALDARSRGAPHSLADVQNPCTCSRPGSDDRHVRPLGAGETSFRCTPGNLCAFS
ncbi:hypothetical protein ACFPM0_06385 [Pseudonocardia sulfidoxydans]|uniref:hypothetical protein n=1 Tax=Pseudonocardia sulfidoxydans TaxID=54011 RepID=UPI00361D5252